MSHSRDFTQRAAPGLLGLSLGTAADAPDSANQTLSGSPRPVGFDYITVDNSSNRSYVPTEQLNARRRAPWNSGEGRNDTPQFTATADVPSAARGPNHQRGKQGQRLCSTPHAQEPENPGSRRPPLCFTIHHRVLCSAGDAPPSSGHFDPWSRKSSSAGARGCDSCCRRRVRNGTPPSS